MGCDWPIDRKTSWTDEEVKNLHEGRGDIRSRLNTLLKLTEGNFDVSLDDFRRLIKLCIEMADYIDRQAPLRG